MLVRSSSGEHTFYKVKDANNVVLTDSLGNEPKGETAKLYVLKKKISAYRSCKLNRLVVQIHKVCKKFQHFEAPLCFDVTFFSRWLKDKT